MITQHDIMVSDTRPTGCQSQCTRIGWPGIVNKGYLSCPGEQGRMANNNSRPKGILGTPLMNVRLVLPTTQMRSMS